MIPFLILIGVSTTALLLIKLISGVFNIGFSARLGMSAMLYFTAVGHFLFTEGMAMMIPDIFPYKTALVYLTAFIEVIAAIGLQIPRFRKLTACLLILFFIAVLPANIKASLDHINYQTSNFNGPGLEYLWYRIPLQLLFILWVYFSSIYPPTTSTKAD